MEEGFAIVFIVIVCLNWSEKLQSFALAPMFFLQHLVFLTIGLYHVLGVIDHFGSIFLKRKRRKKVSDRLVHISVTIKCMKRTHEWLFYVLYTSPKKAVSKAKLRV